MTFEPSIFLIDRSVTKLSAAIVLEDALIPDRKPAGSIRVWVRETNEQAVKNAGGTYMLCDYKPGTYTVLITSEFYSDEEREVAIPGSDEEVPVLTISLLPKPVYPFPEDTALLRGIVRREDGKVLRDVVIQAVVMQSQSQVKAKLAATAAAGDSSILLRDVQGALKAGDLLMIRETGFAESEFCRISEPLPDYPESNAYAIAEPIRFRHSELTPLYMQEESQIIQSKTTENGEWVIPVANMKAVKLSCTIVIEASGLQPFRRDAELEYGQSVSMGVITLLA